MSDATELSDQQKNTNNVLRVKADPPGTTREEQAARVRALGGAICHTLRKHGEVYVRAIGPEAVHKAAKGVATARTFVAGMGYDLYSAVHFIVAKMGANAEHKEEVERTGICFLCVTSSVNEDDIGRMIKTLQARGYKISAPEGQSHPALEA